MCVCLVNHEDQKHGPQTIGQCNHCGKSFNIQGLPNHKHFCARATNGLT